MCRVTRGHLRVAVGQPKVTVGHPRITRGHLRATIGNLVEINPNIGKLRIGRPFVTATANYSTYHCFNPPELNWFNFKVVQYMEATLLLKGKTKLTFKIHELTNPLLTNVIISKYLHIVDTKLSQTQTKYIYLSFK